MAERKITAIIPVREGSRRLKNKNVAPFAGTNLLINKINQLKQVQEINTIVVSSDSQMMLEMARQQGVATHKRAPEFCDEKSKTFGEVVAHICENVPGDDILWATCTLHWSSRNSIVRQSSCIIKRWKMDTIPWFLWNALSDISGMRKVLLTMNSESNMCLLSNCRHFIL